MLFYGALLAEGALRKWVLPDASNALVFLRDPLMLLILAAYVRLGPSRVARTGLAVVGVGTLALILCAACQASTNALPWPMWISTSSSSMCQRRLVMK